MPYRLLLLLLLLLEQATFAQSNHAAAWPSIQTIDSLHTEGQVLAFVQSLDAGYRRASFHPNKPIYGIRDYEKKVQDFGSLLYEKADFDNNGYTDLLFNGYKEGSNFSMPLSLVILCFGRDSLLVKRLPEEIYYDFSTLKMVHINDRAFLHILQISRKSRDEWQPRAQLYNRIDYTERRTDTLVWFQNYFIKRVRPVKHNVEKIRYLLWGGMTLTGASRLTIHGDSVKLEKEADVSPQNLVDSGGVFISRLDTSSRNRLYALLEHLDFTHLKHNYRVRGTDASTGFLEITYDRGKKKTINDYGARGTYGLSALQSLLSELLNTQQWARTDAETLYC